jgi:ATP-dependent protease HslVU (ClpYQ) peptidase subunit
MTTIFAEAKDGLMVCDSKCTAGDNTWYPMTKVHRVGQELVGIAGNVKEGLAWLKWYQSGKKGTRPKLESFNALILRADGLYEACSDGLEMLVERGFHGVGSGGPCAVAAFMAGADAERAVKIACEVDNGSGGAIHVHRLKA